VESGQILEKLRRSRLLTIQDYDYIQPIDGHGVWQKLESGDPLSDYDKDYIPRLKNSLGVGVVLVRSTELLDQIDRADRKRAEHIADTWMREAVEVMAVTREDVVKSAFLYLAYKALLEKHQANAITMSSWALIADGKLRAMPPLAEMELAKELVPCCCESLIDCAVSQMIGTHLAGRPGFVGDQVSDWPGLRRQDAIRPLPDNYVAVGHCYGPINPHGNDRAPYVIRDHAYYELQWGNTDEPRASWRAEDYLRVSRQMKREQVTLAAIRVEWPVDETATLAKCDPYHRKCQVSIGRTFDPHPFFADFDNTACRTKVAIKTEKPFANALGLHLVVFLGDLREGFEDFAALAGYELME
jgi:hypothetical protein